MKLIALRKVWSLEPTEEAYASAARHWAAEGYDGLEVNVADIPNLSSFRALVQDELKMQLVLMLMSSHQNCSGPRPDWSVEQHLQGYERQLKMAVGLNPLKITAHTGSDAWSLAESVCFYERAATLDSAYGVSGLVSHETHRQRSFFSPFLTREILRAVPSTQLNADFSHWTCVCERMLDESEADKVVMREIIKHVSHIHARIGSSQSPQIPFPLCVSFDSERTSFERYWKSIWSYQAHVLRWEKTTLSAEYGPWPYTPWGVEISEEKLVHDETLRLRNLFEDWSSSRTAAEDNQNKTKPAKA